ncbi:MAG: helix-turn-helix domain-containing protein [Vulcanimicrobiaceae bacterium]
MEPKRTYTIEEAAAMLGVSRNSAYAAAARGDFPSVRIGQRILVPRIAFDRFLSPVPEEDNPAA